MAKAAIVVLAGTETHSELGRVVNGMQAAKEFADANDEVKLIFDGAGTQWIPELEDEEHDYHALYASLSEYVYACEYCSNAFGVDEAVEESSAQSLSDYEGHPSIRDLVDDDFEIITF